MKLVGEKSMSAAARYLSLGKLVTIVASLALVQGASAVVVFSDDFSGTGDLNDRIPVVGEYWTTTPPEGGTVTLDSGIIAIKGGTSADTQAFGGFTQPLSASNPIMVVTMDVASIGTKGLSGISLHVANSEKFFIGYRNNQSVYSVAGNGGGVGNNGTSAAGNGELTFTYNFNTGLVEMFDQSGTKVFTKTGTAGLAFDTIRMVSGSLSGLADGETKEFALSDINVQFIPEPSGVLLGAISFGGLLLRRRRSA